MEPYVGNFIYASTEAFDLTIEGGNNEDCTDRVIDPDNTVLDGEENGVVLAFSTPGVVAHFFVDGLTIQNGRVTGYTNGGGIFAETSGNLVVRPAFNRSMRRVRRTKFI